MTSAMLTVEIGLISSKFSNKTCLIIVCFHTQIDDTVQIFTCMEEMIEAEYAM